MLFWRWNVSADSEGRQHDAPQRWSNGDSGLERLWEKSFAWCHCEASWWSRQRTSVAQWRSTHEKSVSTAMRLCDASSWLHSRAHRFPNASLHSNHPQRILEKLKSSANSRWFGAVTSVQQESRESQHQRATPLSNRNSVGARPGHVASRWTNPGIGSTRCISFDLHLIKHS